MKRGRYESGTGGDMSRGRYENAPPRSSSLISLDFRVVKFIRLISKKDNEGITKRLTISVLE